MVILPVRAQMLGQLFDPLREQRDLHLGRAVSSAARPWRSKISRNASFVRVTTDVVG